MKGAEGGEKKTSAQTSLGDLLTSTDTQGSDEREGEGGSLTTGIPMQMSIVDDGMIRSLSATRVHPGRCERGGCVGFALKSFDRTQIVQLRLC